MAEASASDSKPAASGTAHAGFALHAGHALGIAAFLLLPLTVLAPKGLGVLLPATALVGVAAHWYRHRRLPGLPLLPTLIACCLLAWGLASAAWAGRPGSSLSLTAQLAGDFVGGLLVLGLALGLDARERRTVEIGTVAGLLAGLALFIAEWLGSGVLSRAFSDLTNSTGIPYPTVLNRPATMLALCLWPAALVLWKRSAWLGAAAVLASLGLLTQMDSMSALLALPTGILVFALTRLRPRAMPRLIAAILVAGIMVSPLLASYVLPELAKAEIGASGNSVYHRMRIWEFAAHEIAQHPVVGWGLNASRHIGETAKFRLDAEMAKDDPRYAKMLQTFQSDEIDLMPLHPHNAPLQLWLELGAVGAALGGAVVVLIAAAARREADADVTAAWMAQMTVAIVLASISFGLWQAWWQGGLWLNAAIAAAIARRNR